MPAAERFVTPIDRETDVGELLELVLAARAQVLERELERVRAAESDSPALSAPAAQPLSAAARRSTASNTTMRQTLRRR